MTFEQKGTFIVPHQLWHAASVFAVLFHEPPYLVAFCDKQREPILSNLHVSVPLRIQIKIGPQYRLPHVHLFCLFVWSLSSHSRIFHSYGNVIINGEGLQILTYARRSWPLSSEGSLTCHIMYIPSILYCMIRLSFSYKIT